MGFIAVSDLRHASEPAHVGRNRAYDVPSDTCVELTRRIETVPPKLVVLDAMGVLYRHGNVVDGVLVPYLRDRGCVREVAEIRETYRRCTLGQLSTETLWESLGVAETADDVSYCQRHELIPGTVPTLHRLRCDGVRLVALTNDAAPWSALLRRRFDLERSIDDWFVSSDLGARKPDARAYQAVIDGTGIEPSEMVLVDDRPTNLAAAAVSGMRPILFHSEDTHAHGSAGRTTPSVRDMAELYAVTGQIA